MQGKGGGCVSVNLPYYPAQLMQTTPPSLLNAVNDAQHNGQSQVEG